MMYVAKLQEAACERRSTSTRICWRLRAPPSCRDIAPPRPAGSAQEIRSEAILVDTAVWVDHLKRGDASPREFLDDGLVLCHPFVIGEFACGMPSRRAETLELLAS